MIRELDVLTETKSLYILFHFLLPDSYCLFSFYFDVAVQMAFSILYIFYELSKSICKYVIKYENNY